MDKVNIIPRGGMCIITGTSYRATKYLLDTYQGFYVAGPQSFISFPDAYMGAIIKDEEFIRLQIADDGRSTEVFSIMKIVSQIEERKEMMLSHIREQASTENIDFESNERYLIVTFPTEMREIIIPIVKTFITP